VLNAPRLEVIPGLGRDDPPHRCPDHRGAECANLQPIAECAFMQVP
jgi:hypothetical protein